MSTSSTGPALAEHFITITQDEHKYTTGLQYVNLGYIPAGASGLLSFAKVPQRVTPLSFDGMEAWATNPLEQVTTLSDFELVLVITDNPDTVRTWIEQIQPQLEDTPFVAVVSAQAEPILHPYSRGEDAQLSGLVSGITGGAAYEQVSEKEHLARTYWDALNYSLIVAIAIILIGSIVSALSTLSGNKNRGSR